MSCETRGMPHALKICGLANARDLGGLAREDGTTTPTGVFIRAESLDEVDSDGWHELRTHGVRTVIDLRRPTEYTGDIPDDIERILVDLDGDERHFWDPVEADGLWATPLYYPSHIRELPHRLREVLAAISLAEEGGVLFHCAAGWDRTGLVAAVLLRALDVTEDAAAADYLASFANAESMAALHGRSFHVDERHEILSRFGHTADSAFRAVYRDLDVGTWFDIADIDERTRLAITTWRDAVPASAL